MPCPLIGNQFSEAPAEKPVEILAEMAEKTPKTNAPHQIAPTPVRMNKALAINGLRGMPKGLCSGEANAKTAAGHFPHPQPTLRAKLNAPFS
jgi:hypothetical protein